MSPSEVIFTVPRCAEIRPTLVVAPTVSVTLPPVDVNVVMLSVAGLLMNASWPTWPEKSPETCTSKKLPAEPISWLARISRSPEATLTIGPPASSNASMIEPLSAARCELVCASMRSTVRLPCATSRSTLPFAELSFATYRLEIVFVVTLIVRLPLTCFRSMLPVASANRRLALESAMRSGSFAWLPPPWIAPFASIVRLPKAPIAAKPSV